MRTHARSPNLAIINFTKETLRVYLIAFHRKQKQKITNTPTLLSTISRSVQTATEIATMKREACS